MNSFPPSFQFLLDRGYQEDRPSPVSSASQAFYRKIQAPNCVSNKGWPLICVEVYSLRHEILCEVSLCGSYREDRWINTQIYGSLSLKVLQQEIVQIENELLLVWCNLRR
jgi:hypothetical protein